MADMFSVAGSMAVNAYRCARSLVGDRFFGFSAFPARAYGHGRRIRFYDRFPVVREITRERGPRSAGALDLLESEEEWGSKPRARKRVGITGGK